MSSSLADLYNKSKKTDLTVQSIKQNDKQNDVIASQSGVIPPNNIPPCAPVVQPQKTVQNPQYDVKFKDFETKFKDILDKLTSLEQKVSDIELVASDERAKNSTLKNEHLNLVKQCNDNAKEVQDIIIDLSKRFANFEK